MGSKSSPAPQPAAQVPQPPSYGQQLSDYVANYPKMYALQEEYSPKEAKLTLDLLQQYGPQYNQFLKEQQAQLTPETAKIEEGLASLVNQNAGYGANVAGVPQQLQSQYLDTLRSELGPNAGSGIGADYVSRGLAQLGEQYKANYQNLGMSLLGRQPVQSAMSSVPYQNPSAGLGGMMQNNAANYGTYVQGLTQMPYYTSGGGGGNGLVGGLTGAASGAMVGSAFGPWGAGIGGLAGYFGGR